MHLTSTLLKEKGDRMLTRYTIRKFLSVGLTARTMSRRVHLVIAALAAVLIAGLMTTAAAQEPFQGSESPGEILGDINTFGGRCLMHKGLAAAQEPFQGSESPGDSRDINTFGGRLHKGLVVVPGIGIQLLFPLHHWEGAQGGGGPLGPEWQVNKGTGSGYCQVCVYLFDNFPFFGTTPPTVTGVPIVNQVCKMMTDAQRSVNVRMPKALNSNEHGDALATMACEHPVFVEFRTKQTGP